MATGRRPDSTGRTVARRSLRLLASLSPRSASPSEKFVRSLSFLGLRIGPSTVVDAGYGAGLVVFLVTAPLLVLTGTPPVLSLSLPLVAAVAVVHAIHALPVTLARLRKTSALGAAPDLVGRAVLRMRIVPTPESAAAFVAETGEGPLAASLAEHVRRARGTPGTGLSRFAGEWAEWFPALRRAMLLVEAAGEAPPTERNRTLDRALSAVLDGTRARMAAFASDVRGPATGLYAFGVLLPLALASALPAAGAAGLPVALPVVVAAYDLLLPAGLAVASIWLLSRRPVAFRPARVPPDHPDVPDRRWPAVGAAIAAAFASWLAVGRLVAAWAAPLAAIGAGFGVALAAWYRHEKRVRDRAGEIEAGLADALYLVGRRVDGGTAVEAAVVEAAEEVAGPAGDVLADAARRQRQLKLGLRAAFLGDHGPLATVPSPRARSAAAMLALAAREGRPAGAAAVELADHLDELSTVERDARASLSRLTDTLASTAAVFGPVVGGVTVALGDAMGTFGSGGDPLPTPGLGLAVGAYVLLLSVLLTALSVGLARGLDRALVGYRCGLALASATACYLCGFVAAGLVV